MFILGRIEDCIDLLINTQRIPEAAFLARTYMPSLMGKVVALWKADLAKVSTRASQALADPTEYPNLFPDLEIALEIEDFFKRNRNNPPPASSYPEAKEQLDYDLIERFKAMKEQQAAATVSAAPPPPVQDPVPSSPPVDIPAEDNKEDTAKAAAEKAAAEKAAAEKAAAEKAAAEKAEAEKA